MDYSAANVSLWNGMVQIAILAGILIFANVLRRKVPFVRRTLLPTAVLAGFLVLIFENIGWLRMDVDFLEKVTYHALGLGFISLALRVPKPTTESDRANLTGLKSGALIASTYVLQGVFALIISMLLFYTIKPDMFMAAGILLPMGYGQGPGQANNIGSTFENLGFAGGQSFGLALAATGFLCACVIGVIYLNILRQKGKLNRQHYDEVSGSVTLDTFEDENEIPIAESVDRFTMNLAIVLLLYGVTYLFSRGLTDAISAGGAEGLAKTANSLIWGFNFLIGTLFAILARKIISLLRRQKVMTRRYQNNYLLSRCAGVAFDMMIVAGIASIRFEELSGLWLPFLLMAVGGGFLTFYYLLWLCKRIYPNYYYEGFFSMFGMLTGTISSGVLLLREVDSAFDTPAANNLLIGSGCAILFGAPILALVGIAPISELLCWLTLAILILYFCGLLLFMKKAKRKSR